MARPRLSPLALAGLLTVALVAFSDLFTYSGPDSFLGPTLAATGASSAQVMVAYGINGATTTLFALLLLLAQSLPAAARQSPGAKWGLVIAAQALVTMSSLLAALTQPAFLTLTAVRSLHGIATAIYTLSILTLIVEMSPSSQLGLGIATLMAGMTAGDSTGPVLGAIVADRAGLRAAFGMFTGVNSIALTAAVALVLLWRRTPLSTKRRMLLESSSSRWCLPEQEVPPPGHPKSVERPVAACTLDTCSNSGSHNNSDSGIECIAHGDQPAAAVRHKQTDADDSCTAAVGLRRLVCSDSARDMRKSNCSWGHPQQPPRDSDQEAARTNTSSSSSTADDPQASDDPAGTDSGDARPDSRRLMRLATASELQQCVTASKGADLGVSPRGTSARSSFGDLSRLKLPVPVLQRRQAGLNFRSVLGTLKNPFVCGQCLLLLLEQAMRSMLTVVLPGSMGAATWLVGVAYAANALGAIASPFAVNALLAAFSPFPSHLLSAGLCLVMSTSAVLAILFSSSMPALCVLLLLYGACQSAVETLVCLHVAERTQDNETSSSTHVGLCMFLLAQVAGGGLGSLAGGALQQQGGNVQLAVMAASAVAVTCLAAWHAFKQRGAK